MSSLIPFLRKKVSAKIVFTLYSVPTSYKEVKTFIQRISYLVEPKIVTLGAYKIITVSKRIKKYLIKRGTPFSKVVYIPPAVDLEMFNPKFNNTSWRNKLGISKDEFVILYLGSANPYKGLHILIKALKDIFNEFSNVKAILAIGGAERQDQWKKSLKKVIYEMKLSKRIIELGFIENVAELMMTSDLIIVPYLTTYGIADQPLTILEAMACAKPVIASNIGGIREVIQHGYNGLLFKPGDPKALANVIKVIILNPRLAKKLGKNALKTVTERNDSCNIARQYLDVYGS